MALDTFVAMFRPPFAWREFILQSWFVARVSIVPTLMLAIPFTVLLVFTFNVLLVEFGAADFSGTGAAIGTVTQIGPIVTVLVVAGAERVEHREREVHAAEDPPGRRAVGLTPARPAGPGHRARRAAPTARFSACDR